MEEILQTYDAQIAVTIGPQGYIRWCKISSIQDTLPRCGPGTCRIYRIQVCWPSCHKLRLNTWICSAMDSCFSFRPFLQVRLCHHVRLEPAANIKPPCWTTKVSWPLSAFFRITGITSSLGFASADRMLWLERHQERLLRAPRSLQGILHTFHVFA